MSAFSSSQLSPRMIFRLFTPSDAIVIVIYIAIFLFFLITSLQQVGAAGNLVITSSGQEYRYDLGNKDTIEFTGSVGKTVIEINAEGLARFVHSDCQDKVCILSGYLEKGGDWAACLPNRVIARIEKAWLQSDGPEVDAGSY